MRLRWVNGTQCVGGKIFNGDNSKKAIVEDLIYKNDQRNPEERLTSKN